MRTIHGTSHLTAAILALALLAGSAIAQDVTPPTITCPANITVNNDAGVCSAVVTYVVVATDETGLASLVSTPPSGSVFPVGTTTVAATATDTSGNTASCSFTVTVTDVEPPTVVCLAATSELWAPNHDLTEVGFVASATDNCAGEIPVASIEVQVFSDEDELAPASGNFSPDAKDITAAGTLRLRAERQGDADGRVYLIVAKATDASGNTGFCISTVTVSHDRSSASIASVEAQAAAAQEYAASNNGNPPAGYFVIGGGPIVGPKQ